MCPRWSHDASLTWPAADYATSARLGRVSARTGGYPSQIILTVHELCSIKKSFPKKKNRLHFLKKRCKKKNVENQDVDKNVFFEKKTELRTKVEKPEKVLTTFTLST